MDRLANMPRKSNGTSNSVVSRPTTRSRFGVSSEKNSIADGDATKNVPDKTADITYYTKVKNPSSTNEKTSESGKFTFLEILSCFLYICCY